MRELGSAKAAEVATAVREVLHNIEARIADDRRERERRKALRKKRNYRRLNKENDARLQANERTWQKWWLAEHPGRTAKEYKRLLGDNNSEVWVWRAKGRAGIAAEECSVAA